MHRETTATLQADLVHGHSRLIWLMDELEAHLTGLRSDPMGAEFILDEFVSYWQQFRDYLREHIDEEEAELFPVVRMYATAADHDELRELQGQHAQLLVEMQRFETDLEKLLAAAPDERCETIDRLTEEAHGLRQHLVEHSQDERRFLRSMTNRLSDACLEA